MKLHDLLTTTFFALSLSLPLSLTACDGDDDGGDEAADTNGGDPPSDEDCNAFCVAFVEFCIIPGNDMSWADSDECFAACKMMDNGTSGDTTGNTPQCRLTMIQNQNCTEAGTGTTMCQ